MNEAAVPRQKFFTSNHAKTMSAVNEIKGIHVAANRLDQNLNAAAGEAIVSTPGKLRRPWGRPSRFDCASQHLRTWDTRRSTWIYLRLPKWSEPDFGLTALAATKDLMNTIHRQQLLRVWCCYQLKPLPTRPSLPFVLAAGVLEKKRSTMIFWYKAVIWQGRIETNPCNHGPSKQP